MTRTRDMMLTDPGALIRRMFRDLDPWSEPRGLPFAGLRKTLSDLPWMPPLEMTERDHHLMLKVDLPGLKKEDVGVSLTTEGLVIEGERMQETEDKKNDWFTTERTYGRFCRMVPIPEGVDYKEVKATFRNGVLEITVPIPATAANAPYKVPVEGESEAKTVKVAA
jgi:HSP20 family protein